MKNLILIFCFLLFQTNNDNLEIKLNKHLYHIKDDISFTITNNNDYDIRLYIGIDKLTGNQWMEHIIDISRPNSKSCVILKLKGKSELDKKFKIETLLKFLQNKNESGIYRLKVNFGCNTELINQKLFSSQFRIEPYITQ